MRAYITGGTGFVGSNIVKVFADRGAANAGIANRGIESLCPVNSYVPESADAFWGAQTEKLDLLDLDTAAASVKSFAPDVVVHSMILNDFDRCLADRSLAWRSYVETTETLADAAASAGAKFIVISTDWVFDGTQGGADEETPPNPINFYGVLKMASEMAALTRGGCVARVAAVSGLHRARASTPRIQDAGFGYLVTSIVAALEAGERFELWESDQINMVATPALASECGEVIWRIANTAGADGVFHAVGASATTRMELAQLACEVFELDSSLIEVVAPDPAPSFPVPYDTSLTVARTRDVLGYEPPDVRELLRRFRVEHEGLAA